MLISEIKFNQKLIPWLIALIAAVIYINSLFNGFVWDDINQIVQNGPVHYFANALSFFGSSTFFNGQQLYGIFYRPLQTSIFSAIWSIFGAKPFWFHLFSVLIHCLNVVLLYFVFEWFFKDRKWLAAALTILFAVHPVNVEAVSYISALGLLIQLALGLSALLLLIKKDSVSANIAAAFFVFLGVFAHESAILFVPVLIAFKLLFQKKHFFKFIVAIVATQLIYLLLRFKVAHLAVSQNISFVPELSSKQKIFQAIQIIWFYIKAFIWPVKLYIHQVWPAAQATLKNSVLPLIGILIVVALIVWLAKKGTDLFQKKKIVFFCIWIISGLILYSGFIKLDMTVAERWFYFSMPAWLGIIGTATENIKLDRTQFRIGSAAFMAVIALLAVRTFYRNQNWKSSEVLYAHDLKYQPENYYLNTGLGLINYNQGNAGFAEKYFLAAMPQSPSWAHWIDFFNLGLVYSAENKTGLAEQSYQKSIDSGSDISSYINLAMIYENQKQYQDALRIWSAALANPNITSGRGYLYYWKSVAEFKLGQKKAAIADALLSYKTDGYSEALKLYNYELSH